MAEEAKGAAAEELEEMPRLDEASDDEDEAENVLLQFIYYIVMYTM